MTVSHRSVSQLQTYEQCPHRYYLARVEKVWRKPAAWLAQGKAVHSAIETKHLSDYTMEVTDEGIREVFRQNYIGEINEAMRETPNTSWWFSSGPYRGGDDILRRYGIGLEQVDRFLDYQRVNRDVIWITPDGTPAIELPFDIDLDGVQVKGFIDAVLSTDDELVVRDYKTGSKPGDEFQLGVYSVAFEKQFDIKRPLTGHYWMARTGKETYPYDLTEMTEGFITDRFGEVDEKIRAGEFDARPDPKVCRFCEVAYFCEYAVG